MFVVFVSPPVGVVVFISYYFVSTATAVKGSSETVRTVIFTTVSVFDGLLSVKRKGGFLSPKTLDVGFISEY